MQLDKHDASVHGHPDYQLLQSSGVNQRTCHFTASYNGKKKQQHWECFPKSTSTCLYIGPLLPEQRPDDTQGQLEPGDHTCGRGEQRLKTAMDQWRDTAPSTQVSAAAKPKVVFLRARGNFFCNQYRFHNSQPSRPRGLHVPHRQCLRNVMQTNCKERKCLAPPAFGNQTAAGVVGHPAGPQAGL